ncbi:Cell division control protein 6-like protein B [Hibiscus syriacus]|uniref:Cell division control protein n=1 Tax=Hibiscus syriacus TaxID=106335 RepID=A0A6A2YME9_HIBSY|nr:Cell division control protein 6-like protein B [Hibiscus syriacus]
MPAIADRSSSPFKGVSPGSNGCCTPQKRRLRSDTAADKQSPVSTPMKLKSPRRRLISSPNSPANQIKEDLSGKLVKRCLDPRDVEQMRGVKEALHVSTAPSTVVCREDEQIRVLDFCKTCVEQEKAGSLYVCGCPGTGKSLSMEKVKQKVIDYASMEGLQPPDILTMNCTSLASTSLIFSKILDMHQLKKKTTGSMSPLQHLQKLYSNKQASSGSKMICILIGIANSIDLADRFFQDFSKPIVVTFRAYSKDQILSILQERLLVLPFIVFHQQALELCARKVAAASGDMRKALSVCRSAVEILEVELKETTRGVSLTSAEGDFISPPMPPHEVFPSQDNITVGFLQMLTVTKLELVTFVLNLLLQFLTFNDIFQVRIDHMALALSKTFRSPIVDTIQSLPQHQQIILCSAVKYFRGGKKDTTVGELNKSYIDICKSALIPPVGISEFSSLCRVLSDQGLFKLGQSRDDKFKRVTLKVDEADISFALQVGIHHFRADLEY